MRLAVPDLHLLGERWVEPDMEDVFTAYSQYAEPVDEKQQPHARADETVNHAVRQRPPHVAWRSNPMMDSTGPKTSSRNAHVVSDVREDGRLDSPASRHTGTGRGLAAENATCLRLAISM